MADTPAAERDPRTLTLADFPVRRKVTTRWSDNDMYGHLNNAVYYELFDSAINAWQAAHVTLDPTTDASQGVVAESGCVFYGEVAFPTPLVVGLRVTRLGRSSVTYQLGLFVDPDHVPHHDPDDPDHPDHDQDVKAVGHWVHVEIDATTRRSTPIPDGLRAVMEGALAKEPT